MKIRLVVALLLLPVIGAATEISIGGVSLTVPNPTGFDAVTPEMRALYELQKRFVPSTNEEYAAFIPVADVSAALQNEIPALPRRFTVQTAKSLVDKPVSTSEFSELKNIIRTQNDRILKKVESRLPGLMRKMNEGFEEQYDIDPAFSVSQMVPLPAHEETDRTLSYSALVRYDMNDAEGKPYSFVSVVTATFVHVKGKVLFLYSFAEEADLDWSRDRSRQWASDVVLANPPDRQSVIAESRPSRGAGIDWGRVGAKALAGAIIGLLIGLIAWAMRRGKAS